VRVIGRLVGRLVVGRHWDIREKKEKIFRKAQRTEFF